MITKLILLVEDDENDVFFFQRAVAKAGLTNPIQVAGDGQEAINYLRGVGKFAQRAQFPLPDMILLDLKLPGLDGFDFLLWLRQQPGLERIRVVVLSSSDRVRDIDHAYKLGANSYLIKPLDFERFVEISLALHGYWLWFDKLPEDTNQNASAVAQRGSVASAAQEPGRITGIAP